MLHYFSQYWFDFVYTITVKEIKARYKRVVLGFLWIILNPILQMLIIGFVFQFFIRVEVENYFYFLFAGLLPWNFFSFTFSKCTPIFLNERHLIQKAKFPREALVLSIVFSNLFHFIISLVLFSLIALFVDPLFFSKLPLLLMTVVLLVLLTIGFSLLSSALFVKFRDIKFVVQAILPLWFYATPIIYTRELLPEKFSLLLQLNPMVGIVEMFQFVYVPNLVLTSDVILITISITAIVFILGTYFFHKECPYFDDWL